MSFGRLSVPCLVLLTTVASACAGRSDEAGASERARATSSAIINGKNSDASQDAVVLIEHPEGRRAIESCTGTLIAANLVLTARHCVSKVANGAFSCDDEGVGSAGGNTG